jgi:hypothetical protein
MNRGMGDKMTDEIPMELRLDLLVDGELPEADRGRLLLELESAAGGPAGPWKDLAIRFLQRQVEKETVRKLMDGGTLMPVEWAEPVAVAPVAVADAAPAPVIGRIGAPLMWTLGVAAGLLLVATSAMVTFYLTQPAAKPAVVAEFQASLPADAVSFHRSVPVTVPVWNASGSAGIFPVDDGNPRISRWSTVLQPAGNEKAMMIEVRKLKAAVY